LGIGSTWAGSTWAGFAAFPAFSYAATWSARFLFFAIRDGKQNLKWGDVWNGWAGIVAAAMMSVLVATAQYSASPGAEPGTAMSSMCVVGALLAALLSIAAVSGWATDPKIRGQRGAFVFQAYWLPHVLAVIAFVGQMLWVVLYLPIPHVHAPALPKVTK
jgi:hypothetical protein